MKRLNRERKKSISEINTLGDARFVKGGSRANLSEAGTASRAGPSARTLEDPEQHLLALRILAGS